METIWLEVTVPDNPGALWEMCSCSDWCSEESLTPSSLLSLAGSLSGR